MFTPRHDEESNLERFTISLSDELAAGFDRWIQSRQYSNRSEAVRDLLRKEITAETLTHNQAEYGIASVSFVYNHHERNLAERLTTLQHEAHDLVICSTHVHLDHDNCLENLFLRGTTQAIRTFADMLAAEPGARQSKLNMIPVHVSEHHHHHHLHDPDHHHIHPMS